MSSVWQEGNVVSPRTSFLCFSLVPHRCWATEGLWWFLDTFCSSRVPEKAHCLRHRRHVFVCTGSPDFHRFTFHTNHAWINMNPHTSPFTVVLCLSVRLLRSGGAWAVGSAWRRTQPVVPCCQHHWAYVHLCVCCCRGRLCCIFLCSFTQVREKLKMLMLILRNIGLISFACFD